MVTVVTKNVLSFYGVVSESEKVTRAVEGVADSTTTGLLAARFLFTWIFYVLSSLGFVCVEIRKGNKIRKISE